ncbi:MAG: translation initiation factor IF-5A [Candidatus Diapherotrites archaeon]|nr:translation initiation factor IF-5A [Candidatus Diapherotrites archaeon]
MVDKILKKAGQLKEGNYMLIEGSVCRIKSIDKSSPGRHGSAKVRITAVGVFDNQKRTFLGPVDAEVEVPIIKRGNAQVVAVMGDVVQIMDLKSYELFNVKKPADITGLKSGVELEYMRYADEAAIVRIKSNAEGKKK